MPQPGVPARVLAAYQLRRRQEDSVRNHNTSLYIKCLITKTKLTTLLLLKALPPVASTRK